jgi:hypothetical protein
MQTDPGLLTNIEKISQFGSWVSFKRTEIVLTLYLGEYREGGLYYFETGFSNLESSIGTSCFTSEILMITS